MRYSIFSDDVHALTFDNGELIGREGLKAFIVSTLRVYENFNQPIRGYMPSKPYYKDALAVRLIAEQSWPSVRLEGDVPDLMEGMELT